MNIFSLPCGPFDTNAYILSSVNTKDATIVDPGFKSYQKLVNEIEEKGLKIIAIWITHSHWDHIADIFFIKEKFNVPIYIHEEDKGNLENPGSDKLFMPIPQFKGACPDFLIKEGDSIFVGDLIFTVIHTPGHSPGSVCFYCKELKVLISGDTLFKGGMGSLSLATSQADRMKISLKKLSKLEPDTVVYSGHGDKTILKDERWILSYR